MTDVAIQLKYQRHSARKLRPMLSNFSRKMLVEAIDQTSVIRNDSAQLLNKALKMAQAAAQQKHLEKDKLVITELFATEGPKIKRMRPNARGRSNRYQKHLSHITVKVNERAIEAKKVTKEGK